MPRYYFHFASDHRELPAHEGIELPDLDTAVTHAKLAIGTVFKGNASYDWSGWRVSIRDESGREIGEVQITETLRLLGRVARPK
jgi:predicted enzyme related to lactoylglutathione lyase